MVARTGGAATTLVPAMHAQFRAIEPRLSLTFATTMEDMLRTTLMPQRMGTTMLTLFGAIALLLASVGIYGVVSYTVMRRAREIGIRIAVGADARTIIAGVMKDMALPVFMGLAVGAVAVLALGRTVEAFMFGVDPNDLLTFGTISILLLVVAGAAVFGPARRAAGVDPVQVLTVE